MLILMITKWLVILIIIAVQDTFWKSSNKIAPKNSTNFPPGPGRPPYDPKIIFGTVFGEVFGCFPPETNQKNAKYCI